MSESRTTRRRAAIRRSKDRKDFPRVTRSCEDCGTTIEPTSSSYDAVRCWECLKLLNSNQRAARPHTRRGDAA